MRLKNGAVTSFTPQKTRDYERTVKTLIQAQMVGQLPTQQPVRVELRFFMPDRRRVDVDNLAKSILDAANATAFRDDAQILELHAFKTLDREHPRAVVTIETLEAA